MLFDEISDSFTFDIELEPSLLQHNQALASQCRDIIRGLNELGANINAASRLCQYVQLLENSEEMDDGLIDHAMLEMLQFSVIHRALSASNDPSPWLPKVNLASGGRALASEDRTDSRARSEQFELYVMAWLELAGFRVVPTEPDLQARIGHHAVAFAAKRPRSKRKFSRNLYSACKQLATHMLPGFAVLDASFINMIPKPVYVSDIRQQQVLAKVVLDGYAKAYEHEILDAASRPSVLGVLIHTSLICRSVKPVARFVSRRWLLCAARESEAGIMLINALQRLGQSQLAAQP